MRRRVQLLRHAKSSWDEPLPDHDRSLAPRGRRAATALRHHLGSTGAAPDLVLCSTARRAVETWEAVAPACPPGTRVERSDELYGAGGRELLGRLRRLPEPVGWVLLVGHNPGLEDLATHLAGAGDVELLDHLATKFPTGALATLDHTGPWSDLGRGTAELTAYVVPRQLHSPETT